MEYLRNVSVLAGELQNESELVVIVFVLLKNNKL